MKHYKSILAAYPPKVGLWFEYQRRIYSSISAWSANLPESGRNPIDDWVARKEFAPVQNKRPPATLGGRLVNGGVSVGLGTGAFFLTSLGLPLVGAIGASAGVALICFLAADNAGLLFDKHVFKRIGRKAMSKTSEYKSKIVVGCLENVAIETKAAIHGVLNTVQAGGVLYNNRHFLTYVPDVEIELAIYRACREHFVGAHDVITGHLDDFYGASDDAASAPFLTYWLTVSRYLRIRNIRKYNDNDGRIIVFGWKKKAGGNSVLCKMIPSESIGESLSTSDKLNEWRKEGDKILRKPDVGGHTLETITAPVYLEQEKQLAIGSTSLEGQEESESQEDVPRLPKTRDEANSILDEYGYTQGKDSTRGLLEPARTEIKAACGLIARLDQEEAEAQAPHKRLATMKGRQVASGHTAQADSDDVEGALLGFEERQNESRKTVEAVAQTLFRTFMDDVEASKASLNVAKSESMVLRTLFEGLASANPRKAIRLVIGHHSDAPVFLHRGPLGIHVRLHAGGSGDAAEGPYLGVRVDAAGEGEWLYYTLDDGSVLQALGQPRGRRQPHDADIFTGILRQAIQRMVH